MIFPGRRLLIILSLFVLFCWLKLPAAQAAPRFVLSGSEITQLDYRYTYSLYLDTDGETLTAAQVVLNYDSAILEGVALSGLSSQCSFWAPADPGLGFGSTVTPYFYNDEKAVFACGFASPGYTTVTGGGDLIATITFLPIALTTAQSSLDLTDNLFRYIGSAIVPGVNVGLNVSVYVAPVTPTPIPSPTPVNPTTLSSDSLQLITFGDGSQTSVSQNISIQRASQSALPTASPLALVETDDTIPSPPPLSPRPSTTPLVLPSQAAEEIAGEVLSVKSLRELLIPGKSDANTTVVMINLLMTAAFLVILTILLWRIFMISRTNKVKMQRMQRLVEGEIAVLMGRNTDISEEQQAELMQKISQIRDKVENQ